jgi:hypothetical protein
MTTETYGPALGSIITINAPKRSCHGKQGTVVSLHLATNEATVQLRGGIQVIVPWDAESDRAPHGTRQRYRYGCSCLECCEAVNTYIREHPTKNSSAAHGTLTRYKSGCRCEMCRSANAAWLREYRARSK